MYLEPRTSELFMFFFGLAWFLAHLDSQKNLKDFLSRQRRRFGGGLCVFAESNESRHHLGALRPVAGRLRHCPRKSRSTGSSSVVAKSSFSFLVDWVGFRTI